MKKTQPKKKEPKLDGANSLSNQAFIVTDEPLRVKAHCWNRRVRIEVGIGFPYTMNYMLDLSKSQAEELVKQIQLSILDIDSRTKSKEEG